MSKLIGNMPFEEGNFINSANLKQEIKLEQQNIHLFTANSPTELAGGIGKHLTSFASKYGGLCPYLYLIDDWIEFYKTIINSEKEYKKFKGYPEKDFKLYLLHKVFMRKIDFNEVFSTNENILIAVNKIKFAKEAYPLAGKMKKYLGEDVNVHTLTSKDLGILQDKIKQIKEGEIKDAN